MNSADLPPSGPEPETHPVVNPKGPADLGDGVSPAEPDDDETRVVQRGAGRRSDSDAVDDDDTRIVHRANDDRTRVVVRRRHDSSADSLDDTSLSPRRAKAPVREAFDDVLQRRYEPPPVRSGQSARYPARQAPNAAPVRTLQSKTVSPAASMQSYGTDNDWDGVTPASTPNETEGGTASSARRRRKVALITLLLAGIIVTAGVFQTVARTVIG